MKVSLPVVLTLVAVIALVAAAITAFGEVVRPAPDFGLAGGKSLKSFRGQPVVLLVAPSPRSLRFRQEKAELEKNYQGFASRGTVFVAAFTSPEEGREEIRSSIPFVVARDGVRAAQGCGIVDRFGVVVIGRDGNMDLITPKFVRAYRIRDMIINNYQQQASERTSL